MLEGGLGCSTFSYTGSSSSSRCAEPSRAEGREKFQENQAAIIRTSLSLQPQLNLSHYWVRHTVLAGPFLGLNPPLAGFTDTPLQSDLCCSVLSSPFCSPYKPANVRTLFKGLVWLLLLGASSAPRKIRDTVDWRMEGKMLSSLHTPDLPTFGKTGLDLRHSWGNQALEGSEIFCSGFLDFQCKLAVIRWKDSNLGLKTALFQQQLWY